VSDDPISIQAPINLRAVGGPQDQWEVFRQELLDEMGDEGLVTAYVTSFRDVTGDKIRVASNLVYERVKTHWGPLMQWFVNWVVRTTPCDAHIVLLLRDAWPIGKVVEYGMQPLSGRTITPLYLTRALLDIEDESHKRRESVNEKMLREYCAALFDPKAVVVDTGCWGTLFAALYKKFNLCLQTRFFFSHNPWIPSFLTSLGVPDILGEILNDSIEVLLAKRHGRITGLAPADPLIHKHAHLARLNGSGIIPVLKPTGDISFALHRATKLGLFHGEPPTEGMALRILREMAEMHVRSRDTGIWTGILKRNTPTWSGGEAFLASYPEELKGINPPDLLRGSEVLRAVDLSGINL